MAFLSLLLVIPALAQKRQSGSSVRQWTANGTRFETRTTRNAGGKVIESERRSTGKSGVTTLSGKVWGNKLKGTATQGHEVREYSTPTGEKRTVEKSVAKNGTERTTIRFADGSVKKTTTWKVRGGTMTDTRKTDADGKTSAKRSFEKDR